jgi:glycosyltransferase involved in cell wall biosynthesis
MKILHISSARVDYPGGTEKVIWELAKRQAAKNEVTILQTNLYQEKEPFVKEDEKEDVKILTCKNDFFLGGFGFSREFKKKLVSIWSNFDIIHIHGHGRFTSNFAMKFLDKKKPFVYSAQGFFHRRNIIKKAYDFLFGGRLKNAAICTALTEVEVNHLKNKFKISPKNIRVLSPGLDMNSLKKPSKKILDLFRKKYKLNRKTLLYVGRIHESKGLQHVLDAIKDVDCKLLIVGKDSGYKPVLEEKARELGIQNKVIFTGALDDDDLTKAYYSSDSFVLFSEWEGFGIVVIEAMASGLSVVVSNNGSLPHLVKDGINGYIANSGKELKEKILLALKGNKKIIAEGEKFAKQFDWDSLTKNLEKNYAEAIKKSKK